MRSEHADERKRNGRRGPFFPSARSLLIPSLQFADRACVFDFRAKKQGPRDVICKLCKSDQKLGLCEAWMGELPEVKAKFLITVEVNSNAFILQCV